MGVLSLAFGFCCGFYFRNSQIGWKLNNKGFALYKLLTSQDIKEYKLVLVVREDLNMGKGKTASQCSHASVLAYRASLFSNPDVAKHWEVLGEAKVVLKAKSEIDLTELSANASKKGLLTNIVCDAGRTQVARGTQTVLAIGPGPRDLVDSITGHLKLL